MARPHGLRGQVVVELWTNRLERMAPGARLRGPAGELEVLQASPHAAGRGAGRDGWSSFRGSRQPREDAEALRGAVLTAAPLADAEAWWVHELIGAEVVDPIGQRDRGGRVGRGQPGQRPAGPGGRSPDPAALRRRTASPDG